MILCSRCVRIISPFLKSGARVSSREQYNKRDASTESYKLARLPIVLVPFLSSSSGVLGLEFYLVASFSDLFSSCVE